MAEYIERETLLEAMGEVYDCYNPDIERDRNIRKGIVFVKSVVRCLKLIRVFRTLKKYCGEECAKIAKRNTDRRKTRLSKWRYVYQIQEINPGRTEPIP